MTFEKHIPTQWRRYPDIHASIRANGCIAIRSFSDFPRDFKLLPGTRVALFYSKAREAIGIKPINDQCEYSPFKASGTPKAPLIRCKSFLDQYKIPYPYCSWPPYWVIWNEEAGMLMLRAE